MATDYQPNSFKSKKESKEPKKIVPVTNGKVVTKKKKITDLFRGEEVKRFGQYVFEDLLLPAVEDAAINAIELVLYGESSGRGRRRRRNRSSIGTSDTYIPYNRFSEDSRRSERRVARSTGYSYENLAYESRDDAKHVLEMMDNLIDTYGHASVADMYELSGVDTKKYTDNNYGWNNLSDAEIDYDRREGIFVIDLPAPTAIKRR